MRYDELTDVVLLISNSDDIPSGRDISAVRHSVAMNRQYATCMVARDDTISGEMADGRSLKVKRTAKISFLEIARSNKAIFRDENKVAREEGRVRGQEMVKNY